MKNRRVWFPNLLTTANLFCGFFALLLVIEGTIAGDTGRGKYTGAAVTICLAALFDALDGRAARALHVSSPFGKELDSLADVVSFGIAPAVLIYQAIFVEHPLQVLWILATGLFVCCGAGRLARYNIAGASGRFFTGMPIPAAGLTLTGIAVFPSLLSLELIALLVITISCLMISTLRYPNPEQMLFDSPLPLRLMFLSIFLIAILQPTVWFWLLPVSYIVYGILLNLVSAIRAREV